MIETIRTPVFNRYRVLEKIGSGGMGTVYKARDTHLDRWVALKVLPPGMQEDEESVERFKREARALARLKHPGVAAVYDASIEYGFPYLAMEFVEGRSLEQVLEARGTLPVAEVVRIGIVLAEALAHIHAHSIVHRDVKTANIILRPDGQAVITDFGIAFVASLPRISHGALGTPEYMSPEQADGRPLDGRADLYSLGVVLFECLTGAVPFSRTGESLAALTHLMQQLHEAPAPSVRALRPDVPTWLSDVVERCLSKSLDERFASAEELAVALKMAGATSGVGDAVPLSAAPEPAPPSGGRRPTGLREAVRRPPTSGIGVISHLSAVQVVCFAPDRNRLATVSKDRVVRLWDVETGRLAELLEGHEGNVLSVAFSAGGQYVASGDVLGVVRIWEASTARPLRWLEAHAALALSVAFSPDGRRLATGGADGAVRVWDVRKGRLMRTLGWHAGYVLSVAFSASGRHVASGGADGAVHLWDVNSGRHLRTFSRYPAWMISVAFSPDGTGLAAGGADRMVHVWDVNTGRVRGVLEGHADWVMSIAFSPDGTRLVSGGRDGSVRLWDVRYGDLLSRHDEHGGPVMSVAFSPDGRHVASGSSDQTVRVWPFRERRFHRRSALRRFFGWGFVATLAAASLWPELPGGIDPRTAATVQVTAPVPAENEDADPALFGRGDLTPAQGGWTLIVAAEAGREVAARRAAHYRSRGFRAAVLMRETAAGTDFRVAIGQFARQADAVAARRRLAGRVLPYDTWIMRLRPTSALQRP